MLKRIVDPELFFGLVAPIGVDLSEAVQPLQSLLERFNYTVEIIKVTDLFRDIEYCDVPLLDKPSEARFSSYIEFGNRLRDLTGDKAICASLVIDKIAKGRDVDNNGERLHREKHAYIIHQFKRKEEIDLLRSVYGKLFFQISVYSSKGERMDAFAHRIARDHKSTDLDKYKPAADGLIKLDEDQVEDQNGQRVRDVFHLADFIINRDLPNTQHEQLERLVKLIFGSTTLSPTPIEYGMYMAKGASFRSLDLSRQVGAAIFSKRHEVITVGCNEVPKGGGGTYWAQEGGDDARDHKWGSDPNEEKKRSLILDLFERLSQAGLIDKDCVDSIDDMLQLPAVKDSQLMDIIEFGRILHAEMSALMDAARLGRAVEGATLFCTTFPCHICAKHIVGAGVETVYFLEPYPKSAAFSLHPDSIEVEGTSRVHFQNYHKTKFTHFFGISPRRYRDFFEKSLRKNKATGKAQDWLGPENEPRPILDVKLPMYLPLERYVEEELGQCRATAQEALSAAAIVVDAMIDGADADQLAAD